MKVSELIALLQTLEPNWEIEHKTDYEPSDEINFVTVDEERKTYFLD